MGLTLSQFSKDVTWMLSDIPQQTIYIYNPSTTVTSTGETLSSTTLVATCSGNIVISTSFEEQTLYSNQQTNIYSCIVPYNSLINRDSRIVSNNKTYNIVDVKTDAQKLYSNLILGVYEGK